MDYTMNMNILYTFMSVIVVSLISLAGVLTLSFSVERLRKYLFVLVSFAVGALFGDAFLHLIPEAFETMGDLNLVSFWVLLGIGLFFVLEKFFHWTHEHEAEHEGHIHPVGYLNLVSDGAHNFIDGMVIALSYLVSPITGFATTVAVILHEIPQEISDFGILIHSGFTTKKALLWNLISACLAIAGAVFVFLLGGNGTLLELLTRYALPITAGGFIYIAGSDLVPHLNENNKTTQALIQFAAIGIGVFLMVTLTWLE